MCIRFSRELKIMRVFRHLFGFNLLLVALFLEKANNINAANQNGGVYIVYMGTARKDHDQVVRRLLMKRKKTLLVHTYGKSFSGFAAHLSDVEAESMARQPEVVSIFRDRASKLHTTRSWDFLMSQNAYSSSKYDHSNYSMMRSHQSVSCPIGADTIIGIIDSGLWPKHPSFDDKSMGPIPTRWKGECKPAGNSSTPLECNKKLIGARCYTNVTACRSLDGHGTHVASIAAGNLVWGASYKGLAEGIARGGSPCSRIATYNVCDDDGCSNSNILKAYDDAIADGVDVLSLSLGGEHHGFLKDAVAIGGFHAVEKGIAVVCSAGNSGPYPGTVENFAPWILSVGATTTDRVFEISIVLGGGNMSAIIIKGSGIYFEGLSITAVYHLIDGRSASSNQTTDVADAINCVPGSLDDAKVKGKFILCDSDEDYYPHHMAIKLKEQDAVGIIHINNYHYQDARDFSSVIPFAAVNREDGAKINSYISSTSNPLVTMLPTKVKLNNKPAPTVSYISSRGPPPNDILWNHLIKPDVVAPGVNIIAGVPPVVNEDNRIFQMYSGTSGSCPHVSGLAAMIKSVHPTWSPSAIRSAIMTTAIHTNNLHSPFTTQNGSIATPYDIGSGEINMYGSLWPGLVYETSTADYVKFLCNMGYKASSIIKITSSTVNNNFSCPANSSNPDLISDMNYPSIAVSGLTANGSSRTVKRTVTNVGDAWSTYTAIVVAPTNVLQVLVVPKILRFTKNIKTLTFQVSFKLITTSHDDMFGSITWCNRMYKVRSPFVVSNS